SNLWSCVCEVIGLRVAHASRALRQPGSDFWRPAKTNFMGKDCIDTTSRPATQDPVAPDCRFLGSTGCQPVSFGSLTKLLRDSADLRARLDVAGKCGLGARAPQTTSRRRVRVREDAIANTRDRSPTRRY